jgi:hypothetical protein
MIMPKLRKLVGAVALVAVLLFLVLFCLWAGGLRAEARTTVGSRQVVASSTHLLSGVGVSSDGQTATVQVGGQSALVSAEEVEIVGVRKVRLPAACKKVELLETRGNIRILLDGASAD